MFRLVPFLLVVYCSSIGRGALGSVLPESGERIAANRASFILGGDNAERKDVSVIEDDTKQVFGAEGVPRTPETEPTLYVRGPKADKGKGKIVDDKEKGKTADTASSKRSDHKDSDSICDDSFWEDPGFLSSNSAQLSANSASRSRSKTPFSEPEIADIMVQNVRQRLERTDVNPYENNDLVDQIADTVNEYNAAYGRNFRDQGQLDDNYNFRVYILLDELHKIFDHFDGRNKDKKNADAASTKGKGKQVSTTSKKRSPSSRDHDSSSKKHPPPPPPPSVPAKKRRANSV